MRRVLALTMVLMAGLAGCGTAASSLRLVDLDPETTVIEYRFADASVPPEYHRSYRLFALPDSVRIVVDSYGDVLFEQDMPIDVQTWRGLVELASALQSLTNIPPGDSDDCAGGTARMLRISEDDHIVLRADVTVCGAEGQAEADLIDAYVGPLLDLFDMERLLAPSN